jgi:UDP-2,4-diacetamido-2,4,6-trideoxy-beta-L-altropyranose hydrolase
MRDLVLASQYKDANIIFATQELDGNINHKILEAGYEVKILKSNVIDELVDLVQNLKIDLVVIDNYEIDYKYEKQLKEKTGVKILAFDDTYEKHHCDTLLNHNISADESRYKELVPKWCELRCGAAYTLIRDEFIKEKRKKTIFVAIGGSDHSNINIKILKVLKKFKHIKVHVVTTTANKNLHELKFYTFDKKWIKLHIDSPNIAKLMKKSDFGIISPSVIANEAYFMQLPFIAIKTAQNQADMYQYLSNHGYATLECFDKKSLTDFVKNFVEN